MCFCINSKYPEERIAKEDIVCYKTLERHLNTKFKKGIFKSIFQDFIYDFNKKTLYKADVKKLKKDRLVIHNGLHSYIDKPYVSINEDIDIFKCIIPKGTPYYVNDREYVSLKIKFIERLTFKLSKIL